MCDTLKSSYRYYFDKSILFILVYFVSFFPILIPVNVKRPSILTLYFMRKSKGFTSAETKLSFTVLFI